MATSSPSLSSVAPSAMSWFTAMRNARPLPIRLPRRHHAGAAKRQAGDIAHLRWQIDLLGGHAQRLAQAGKIHESQHD